MKKLALILAVIALSGCTQTPVEDTEDTTVSPDEIAAQIQAAGEEIGDSEMNSSYVSAHYEFMVDFPATWNGYEEKVETQETARTITLSAKSDKERFIKLLVINQGDHMPPLKMLGETRNYIIYVEDSMADIEAEREEIYDSFKQIMHGEYYVTPYSGEIMMFTPKDDRSGNIGFTNTAEAYEMFGFEKNGGCEAFSGDATVAVKNVELNEENPHLPKYAAELVEVVNYYPPVCNM